MPRRISLSKELKLLQDKKSELKLQLKALSRERAALLLQTKLMQAWSESLQLMHVCKNLETSFTTSQFDSTLQQQVSLLEQEVQQLQQLTHVSRSSSDDLQAVETDAADILDPGVCTIAPAGDPMAYFRHHVFRPPLQEAATMTAADLAKILREATLQGSVLLHSMQDLTPELLAPIQEQLQLLWDRVMHAAMSLIMVGREDLVETMNIVNLDTLKADAEGSQRVAAQVASTVARLQLTQQQHTIIGTGTSLYMRLLQNVMSERQQLQMQFSDTASWPPAPAQAGTNVVGNSSQQQAQHEQQQSPLNQQQHQQVLSGTSSSRTSSGTSSLPDSFSSRQAQLAAEQQRMSRLQLLMQKEYILRMGGAAWIVGCLSWAQVTRAAVLSWPFPVRFSLIAREIQQQWEATHLQGAPPAAGAQPGQGGGAGQQLSGQAAGSGGHSSGCNVSSQS